MSRYNLLGLRHMYPGMFLNPPTIETRSFGKIYVSTHLKDKVDFSKRKLNKVN